MHALDQHEKNMKRRITNVSQELGPRKGIEAVKSRDELMKVAEIGEEINKEEEMDEVTSAGSAGAFVAPMGWNNDTGMSKPQNEEEAMSKDATPFQRDRVDFLAKEGVNIFFNC